MVEQHFVLQKLVIQEMLKMIKIYHLKLIVTIIIVAWGGTVMYGDPNVTGQHSSINRAVSDH